MLLYQQLRNKMFKDGNLRGFGLDLLAVDVMRGRDNGLSSYAVYYEWCFGKTITKWSDLLSVFPYSVTLRHTPLDSIGLLIMDQFNCRAFRSFNRCMRVRAMSIRSSA